MAKIKKIIAREILDSQANPTIEAIVQLDDNSVGVSSAPSGVVSHKYEALDLRDQDNNRYSGKGVLKALEGIVKILAPRLLGKDADNQQGIDDEMTDADGTKQKSKIGTNSIIALSQAIAKAQASSLKMPLYQYIASLVGASTHQFTIPTPMFNVLNGGKSGNQNLDFQEFMIVMPKASSYSNNIKKGVEVYYCLKDTLIAHNALTLGGDEGGFAPNLYSNTDAFKILSESVTKSSLELGLDIFFSLDAAANNLKVGSSYRIKDRPVPLTVQDFLDFYLTLNEQYRLISLEDPFSDDDWDGWTQLVTKIGQDTLIVADELTTTNLDRFNKAVSKKAINALIIKPNQASTISETIKLVKAAKSANCKLVASSRTGETNDDFIADFSVGIGADYAKFGAPARGERVAKYNRLLEIEHELS